MSNVAALATLAASIGEPARAAMLVALLDGRALTAGELADAAGVTRSTASEHLARLLDARLIAVAAQGRHRYVRLAGTEVAASLESLLALAGAPRPDVKPVRTGPADEALRRARRCYDHLAGEIAVRIADRMIARGQLAFTPDGGTLTESGVGFLDRVGIRPVTKVRQSFCRPCLDWSERRPHIGGGVGRALFAGLVEQGWLRPNPTGRAVTITPPGAAALERHFGIRAG